VVFEYLERKAEFEPVEVSLDSLGSLSLESLFQFDSFFAPH